MGTMSPSAASGLQLSTVEGVGFADGVTDPGQTSVAVLGGTGPQGRGLALRWAAAGVSVVLGSRDAARAASVAAELAGQLHPEGRTPSGTDNATAAQAGQVVVLAVPWSAHDALVTEVAGALVGKVVVDCVNPLQFDARGAHPVPVPAGSSAEQAATLALGARVVGAFHHVSAALLADPTVIRIDSDVLVVGDDRAAVDVVIGLAGLIPGVRGVHAGRLRTAGALEALTANLLAVNRRYRVHAGIRVTDL